MKKNHNKRTCVSITEINGNNLDKNEIFNTISQYNPKSNKFDNLISLYETKTIQKVSKHEALTEKNFLSFKEIYLDVFNLILKSKKIEPVVLIDFFHKISFFSAKFLVGLREFWVKKKKELISKFF